MFISKIDQQILNYNSTKLKNQSKVNIAFEAGKTIRSTKVKEAAKVAGSLLLPIAAFSTVPVSKVSRNQQINVKLTNFNSVFMYELADMLMMSSPAVKYNFDKGYLVKDKNEKFNLDESINKTFVEKYDDDIRNRCNKMTDEDLECYVNSLKKLLKNRVSEHTYRVAPQFFDDPEGLSGYLKYSLSKIVDLDSLNPEQIKMLSIIFEEMIIDELNSEAPRTPVRYESDNKLDIMLYRNLLDELNLRESNISNIAETEAKNNVVGDAELEIDEIKISPELDKIIEKAGEDFEREIKAYRGAIDKNIETLAEAYTQHKFIYASGDYHRLLDFNKYVKNNGIPEEVDEKKIKLIVEKVFSIAGSSNFVLNNSYKNWKREHKVKNAEAVVLDIINSYGNSLMEKICTEEALMAMQKANPTKEIQMQDLEDFVCEKFDL